MTITADQVKDLREITGAGMMDCKKALSETNGDTEQAIDYLRKKGFDKSKERAGRTANQGVIESYIHPGSNLGVMVEVNCETDFVARNDEFKEFAKDIAMQIAAANPMVVQREDIDSDFEFKEREFYLEQAIEQGKPEHLLEKIVNGQIEKFCKTNSLLEQEFVKDSDKTIQELLTDLITKMGENIKIKRFVRFQLGE